MNRIDIFEYIQKHEAEFGVGHPIIQYLPNETNALSLINDPENWKCYPGNVIRLYLSEYQEEGQQKREWMIGVGDFEHPTICTKFFMGLEPACAFMYLRPEILSKQWLREQDFYFLDPPINRPVRIG